MRQWGVWVEQITRSRWRTSTSAMVYIPSESVGVNFFSVFPE